MNVRQKHTTNDPCKNWKSDEIKVQAVLILLQGYVPEKYHANQTQNSSLKKCISWGVRGLTSSYTVGMQTCRVHIYCIYSIYTFLYNVFIYLLIMQ